MIKKLFNKLLIGLFITTSPVVVKAEYYSDEGGELNCEYLIKHCGVSPAKDFPSLPVFKVMGANLSVQESNNNDKDLDMFQNSISSCNIELAQRFFEISDSYVSSSDISQRYGNNSLYPYYLDGSLSTKDETWHYWINIGAGWGWWASQDNLGKVIYFACSNYRGSGDNRDGDEKEEYLIWPLRDKQGK